MPTSLPQSLNTKQGGEEDPPSEDSTNLTTEAEGR